MNDSCNESETYNQGFKDGEKHERKKWIAILTATFTNKGLIDSIEQEVNLYDGH